MAFSVSSLSPSSPFSLVESQSVSPDARPCQESDLRSQKLYHALISANPPTDPGKAREITERTLRFIQDQKVSEPPKEVSMQSYSNHLPTLVRSLLAPHRKPDHPDFKDTLILCQGLLEDLENALRDPKQDLTRLGLTPASLVDLKRECKEKENAIEPELAALNPSHGPMRRDVCSVDLLVFSPAKPGSTNPFVRLGLLERTGRCSAGGMDPLSPSNIRPGSNPRPASARLDCADPFSLQGLFPSHDP